jgi:5-methylcytosine-specific restriction endonuclease McrA
VAGTKKSRLKLSKKEYAKLRYEVAQRDKLRCKVCRVRENLHTHHIIFRSHGGSDASWNLLTVCFDCHEAIHNRYVIILPLRDGEQINADEGVKLMFVNNWKPKRKVR